MGKNIDESVISTASSLIDSCSASLNATFEDEIENTGGKPLLCSGRISNFTTGSIHVQKGKGKIVSPITTTAINISNDWSETTTNSKLDKLRAKNKLLRKQSIEKIEESRGSLRKSRTLAIDSPPPKAHPPPYPPPSLRNTNTATRTNKEQTTDDGDFTDFLRRSNSVIDRLSTEIAVAGSIINDDSSRADRTVNTTTVVKQTNDFTSNLYPIYQNDSVKRAKRKNMLYESKNVHNISLSQDWDQSTISATATPPDSPSSSARGSRSVLSKATPSRNLNTSGLPPPEVLVKRLSPQASPAASIGALDESFWGAPNTKFAPKAKVLDRHRRQRPPSISSIGDCASMYNTNQKCEKLALENDCLRRQLDLLESRHRDAQRKLMEQEHREVGRAQQVPGTAASSTSKATYMNRKNKSMRHRFLVLLVLSPFMISSMLWLHRSLGSSHSSARDGIGLASIVRDSIFGQASPGENVFSESESDANNEDTCTIDFLDEILDSSLILHEPPVEYHEFKESTKEEETKSSKFASGIKHVASKMKHRHDHDFMGVWLKKDQQIKMKKRHSEL